MIERTQVTGNTYGIVANGGGGTALVEVRYSTIADSAFDGIWAFTAGSTASIVVEHSASVRNGGNGINAQGAGAYVSLNDSTVDWNATGLTTSSGGLILSYQEQYDCREPQPRRDADERQPAVRNRARRKVRKRQSTVGDSTESHAGREASSASVALPYPRNKAISHPLHILGIPRQVSAEKEFLIEDAPNEHG